MRSWEHRKKNIRVKTRLEDDLPPVTGDARAIQQVLLNIIANAEYFMIEAHGYGVLEIGTWSRDKHIGIDIKDDGPGIPQEKIPFLFEPFYTSKPRGKGTGLGLSICHKLINEHGGNIYASSVPGKGATFTVELPVA